MPKQITDTDGRRLWLYGAEAPELLFLQPVDAHEAQQLEQQVEAMQSGGRPFALAAFEVSDWNRDLSPWEAPPVFGTDPFRGGAAETLAFVTQRLLPVLKAQLPLREDSVLCLGGYSLAGLFALWASTQTDWFSGVAAASPSVWYPGWIDYVKAHPIRAPHVYLSLGDREERTKNSVMAGVGDCIREQYELLRNGYDAVLEWNPGNHFREPGLRTARAFCWLAACNYKNERFMEDRP